MARDNILVRNPLYNSFVILSSRPGADNLRQIAAGMDTEIHIEGFSSDSILNQAIRYLGDQDTASKLIAQAEEKSIEDILHIPIIHAMACMVFKERQTLPESKNQLVGDIIYMSIDRTAQKTLGKRAKDIGNLQDLLIKLGKLSWASLQSDSSQLLLNKVKQDFPPIKGLLSK